MIIELDIFTNINALDITSIELTNGSRNLLFYKLSLINKKKLSNYKFRYTFNCDDIYEFDSIDRYNGLYRDALTPLKKLSNYYLHDVQFSFDDNAKDILNTISKYCPSPSAKNVIVIIKDIVINDENDDTFCDINNINAVMFPLRKYYSYANPIFSVVSLLKENWYYDFTDKQYKELIDLKNILFEFLNKIKPISSLLE